MLKQIRPIFSAMLIATFFVSTFLFSPSTAQACPPRIPATLLSLYLQSDLIVLADYENERIIKKTNENEHGFYASLERDLSISKIYKGNSQLKSVLYKTNEYRQKNAPTSNAPQIKNFRIRGYSSSVPVKLGGQYLFFLRKSTEGKYTITDNLGGIKDSDEYLGVYEENFNELKAIVQNKDNQLENITEWLIKALEEPVTRWGAIQDLYNSSNSLAYEKTLKKQQKVAPIVFDKSFNTYSSAIAKNLNDSQKAKLSNILSNEIQRSWFGEKPKRVDYRLLRIAENWDKARLASDAFSILQGLDESKFQTKLIIMEFISNITGDSDLRNKYYEYSRIELGNTPQAQVKNLNARNVQMQKYNSRFQTLLIQNFEHIAKN